MNWIYIRDRQPKNNEIIIQIDRPYKDFYKSDFTSHYCISMREYIQYCSWENIINEFKIMQMELPDFWWISAKDFKFPDLETKNRTKNERKMDPKSASTIE